MEKTLLKGLTMLEEVARSDEPCGVSDLARRVGITKSNAHRLLQTLVAAKYVTRDSAAGTYSASPRLFEFGMLVGSRIDVRKAALPIMRRLSQQTGENVALAVLDAGEVMYLERIDSPSPVRSVVRTGQRLPSYCSSSGKVLLAFAPQGDVDALEGKIVRFTDRTVADVPALKADLAIIRQQGYGLVQGEWHREVSSVAVPIQGRRDGLVAALAISGPTDRFTPQAIARHIAAAQEASAEIAEQLP